MIQFKCWYCGRRHAKPEQQIGQRLKCSCEFILRVPKKSGGNCRVKSVADWLVQALVCGGAGALLGFGLAVLMVSQMRFIFAHIASGYVLMGLPGVGFVAGLVGGNADLIGWGT